ncbi:carbohydrate porin [Rhodocytophaga rosea]|uniref:Carbohydrate porin n=1 Tax=Rhodocytophaga rosea TaxID=2704465 RepID=A0A6C0GJN0_9BACT|nr:carbohydrate porin [Rhodocytophaga rosea]QHT68147.1 carbohydrate porin [Rhodocytophaga rosea]
MRKFYISVLIIYLIQNDLKAQNDTIPEEIKLIKKPSPISYSIAYTIDAVGSVSRKNMHYLGLVGNVDLKVDFDTKKANLWPNGTLHLYGINNHGAQPTTNVIGDLQGVSNIEAPERTYLFELWYEQKLGPVSLLAGQHDVNSEFATTSFGFHFINGSFGFQPDIALNTPVSNFSFSTIGIRSKAEIRKNIVLSSAIYKGNPGNKDTNPYGVNWKISPGEGYFTIHEFQYNWQQRGNYKGSFKIGSWYHSKVFQSLTDSSRYERGNRGIYGIADQLLFINKNKPSNKVGLFLQLGMVPKNINLINFYTGTGLVYTGMLPKRANDVIGIAIANAQLNNKLVNVSEGLLMKNENVIEFTYQALINRYIIIQPNIQYIVHPGSRNTSNQLITIMRVSMKY